MLTFDYGNKLAMATIRGVSKSSLIKMTLSFIEKEFPYSDEWAPIVNGKYNRYKLDRRFDMVKEDSREKLIDLIELLFLIESGINVTECFDMITASEVTFEDMLAEITIDLKYVDEYREIIILRSQTADEGTYNCDDVLSGKEIIIFIIYHILKQEKNLKCFKRFEKPIKLSCSDAASKLVSNLTSINKSANSYYQGCTLFLLYHSIIESEVGYEEFLKLVTGQDGTKIYLLAMMFLTLEFNEYTKTQNERAFKVYDKKISILESSIDSKDKQIDKYETKDTKINELTAKILKLEAESESLYSLLDDYSSRIAGLQLRLDTAESILKTYKKQDSASYEEHEIEALVEFDEIDISKLKVCVIADSDFKNKYSFYVYDYIRAPKRIDLLLKYDLVVLAVPVIKHKHSIAIVDYCKKYSIEYMYTTSVNPDIIAESIKSYVRLKGLA